ncbi:hypothetical protein HDE_06965 [Halotydeus destructor]|nr:hypothetical protein HDE_06965 [Halotydeus destructor]
MKCLYRFTKRFETGINIFANYIPDMDDGYSLDEWLLMENIKSRPNLLVIKIGKIVDNTAHVFTSRFSSKPSNSKKRKIMNYSRDCNAAPFKTVMSILALFVFDSRQKEVMRKMERYSITTRPLVEFSKKSLPGLVLKRFHGDQIFEQGSCVFNSSAWVAKLATDEDFLAQVLRN